MIPGLTGQRAKGPYASKSALQIALDRELLTTAMCRGCVKTEAQVHAADSQEGSPTIFPLICGSTSSRRQPNKKGVLRLYRLNEPLGAQDVHHSG